MSNTPVMDSPEVLGHALCRHVPDMRKGFTIQTRHGDIYVTADDAAPFADAMERLLMSKIRQIQGEGSPERDQQLYQEFKGNSLIELTERFDIPSFKGLAESIHRGAEATDNTLSPEEARIVSDALVKLVRRIHAGGRTAPGVFGALSILYMRGLLGKTPAEASKSAENLPHGFSWPKSHEDRINEVYQAALHEPTVASPNRQENAEPTCGQTHSSHGDQAAHRTGGGK